MRRSIWIVAIVIVSTIFLGCAQEPTISDQERSEKLADAVSLANAVGAVMVTTVGIGGIPHTMIAGEMNQAGFDSVTLTDWSCPQTAANVINQDQTNSRSVSIAIWDTSQNLGYQLLGHLKTADQNLPVMQVEYKNTITASISKVLALSKKDHSDKEELEGVNP